MNAARGVRLLKANDQSLAAGRFGDSNVACICGTQLRKRKLLDRLSFRGAKHDVFRREQQETPAVARKNSNVRIIGRPLERVQNFSAGGIERSEERRVGKECRSRWSPY